MTDALEDKVILSPVQGADLVCGSTIAGRTWTTIGMERRYNPQLQKDVPTHETYGSSTTGQ